MINFSDFARAHGFLINNLRTSNNIQRCATSDHPHRKNGAYSFDGERGFIFDWAGEAKAIWFNDPSQKPLTDDEKRAYMQKRMGDQDLIARRHNDAAQAAKTLLAQAEIAEHPYLAIKGFEAEKGFVNGIELLIPMRDVLTNEVQTLQRIYWLAEERRYEKKMFAGGKAKGAVFVLGNKSAPEAVLCEGYCTGLSIKRAVDSVGLKMAVYVCFSDSNLVYVASVLKNKCFVFADNDVSKAGENAALKAGLPYVMADEVGLDANDLMLNKGVFAVAKKIMQLRTKSEVRLTA